MADDVCQGIDNALNLVVNKVERSGNMKKELKQTIFETVSSLRNLFSKLKDSRDRTLHTIDDLEGQAAAVKVELEACRNANTKVLGAPSLSASQEPDRKSARGLAPPPDGSEGKLYSQALGNEGK
jgi:DNA anti-recombination protein RmuC